MNKKEIIKRMTDWINENVKDDNRVIVDIKTEYTIGDMEDDDIFYSNAEETKGFNLDVQCIENDKEDKK